MSLLIGTLTDLNNLRKFNDRSIEEFDGDLKPNWLEAVANLRRKMVDNFDVWRSDEMTSDDRKNYFFAVGMLQLKYLLDRDEDLVFPEEMPCKIWDGPVSQYDMCDLYESVLALSEHSLEYYPDLEIYIMALKARLANMVYRAQDKEILVGNRSWRNNRLKTASNSFIEDILVTLTIAELRIFHHHDLNPIEIDDFPELYRHHHGDAEYHKIFDDVDIDGFAKLIEKRMITTIDGRSSELDRPQMQLVICRTLVKFGELERYSATMRFRVNDITAPIKEYNNNVLLAYLDNLQLTSDMDIYNIAELRDAVSLLVFDLLAAPYQLKWLERCFSTTSYRPSSRTPCVHFILNHYYVTSHDFHVHCPSLLHALVIWLILVKIDDFAADGCDVKHLWNTLVGVEVELGYNTDDHDDDDD